MRGIEGKHTTQAPADQAYFLAGLVVEVADLLLDHLGVAAIEADVLAKAPGLDLVVARLQEQPQGLEGRVAGRKPRQ